MQIQKTSGATSPNAARRFLADCRRSLSCRAQALWHRLSLRGRRHGHRPHHRGLRKSGILGPGLPDADHRRPREPRGRRWRTATTWRAAGRRRSCCTSASAPPTPCARSSTRRARQRADAVHRRPHAAVRAAGRSARATHDDPLGAGDVRPGRDAARAREVGLRAARRHPRRRRSWSTALSRRHDRTARPRLPVACRGRCWPRAMPGRAQPPPRSPSAAGAASRPRRRRPAGRATRRAPASRSSSAPPSGADPRTVPLLATAPSASASAWPRAAAATSTSRPPSAAPGLRSCAALSPMPTSMLFLECDVPWIPATGGPRATPSSRMRAAIRASPRYPMRSFRSDLTIDRPSRAPCCPR